MIGDAKDFTLRPEISANDRNKIYSLLSSEGFFTPREIAYGMNLFDRRFREGDTSDFRFMMMEQGAALLGYGCYGLLPLCNRRYHIYWLAVGHRHKKQGIGTMLEEAIAADIRHLGGDKIYAEHSNRGDINPEKTFYNRCGYHLVATIPDYYADGDDMLLFEKNL